MTHSGFLIESVYVAHCDVTETETMNFNNLICPSVNVNVNGNILFVKMILAALGYNDVSLRIADVLKVM